MNIGFVGLGHMGKPMAKNLLKAGFSVVGYDVFPDAVKELAQAGATPASSLAEVAKNADVIFTMLQTGQQVKDVCMQADGLFAHARKNTLFIDSSSIEIAISRELHQQAEKLGFAMLDAPVSGGVPGAEAATLTFMVGGTEENVARAKPILEKVGKKIVHTGAAGVGQAAKICNNLILGISMIAVSEGFALGEKLGLDPKKLFEVSSNGSGKCWSMTNNCPVPGVVEGTPSNFDYRAGFMAKMMLKDLRLGQAAADSVGAAIPLGSEAAELYAKFVNEGFGELDFSGIIRMLSSEKS